MPAMVRERFAPASPASFVHAPAEFAACVWQVVVAPRVVVCAF